VKLKLHHNKNRLGFRPRPLWGSLQRSPTPLAGFQFIGPSGLYCRASIVGPSGLCCEWLLFLVFKCWHVCIESINCKPRDCCTLYCMKPESRTACCVSVDLWTGL